MRLRGVQGRHDSQVPLFRLRAEAVYVWVQQWQRVRLSRFSARKLEAKTEHFLLQRPAATDGMRGRAVTLGFGPGLGLEGTPMLGSLILFVAVVFTNSPLKPLVQNMAIEAEIMDPRERPYIMAEPQSFTADCLCLARRYLELAEAPPLSDCRLLPDHKTCCEMMTCNRAYRNTLLEWQAFAPADYTSAINEVDRLYAVWDAANDAGSDYYHVTVQRHALAKLREMIGVGRYYAGAMPAPVPLLALEDLDQ